MGESTTERRAAKRTLFVFYIHFDSEVEGGILGHKIGGGETMIMIMMMSLT